MPNYEIFAIKYASHERNASANFIGSDLHDAPMPLDYYVWLIRGAAGLILVDVGFGPEAAKKRSRQLIRRPVDALALLGVSANQIGDIVITHLHYDHAGCLDDFPSARFHLQEAEMAYTTGRHMRHSFLKHPYAVDDVIGMVRRVYAGRVEFYDGTATLADGITLHRVGGHTLGLQAVRVETARGPVVLASDAVHLYRNLTERRPFPIVHDIGAMMDGWRELLSLAGDLEHLVPGHDPLVGELYPAPSPELQGIVSALHLRPNQHPLFGFR